MNDNYYKALDTLFNECFSQDLCIKHDFGVIINIKEDIVTKFVACEVDKSESSVENVIKINGNTFLCKKTNEFNFDKICNMFSHVNNNDNTIIISPVHSYDLSSPYFEVRCSL